VQPRKARIAPIQLERAAAAQAALGKRVRIAGIAGNAKLGAVVLLGNMPFYLVGKTEWDSARRGGRVVVIGLLEKSDHARLRPAPSGAISQGTSGPIYRLLDVRVE